MDDLKEIVMMASVSSTPHIPEVPSSPVRSARKLSTRTGRHRTSSTGSAGSEASPLTSRRRLGSLSPPSYNRRKTTFKKTPLKQSSSSRRLESLPECLRSLVHLERHYKGKAQSQAKILNLINEIYQDKIHYGKRDWILLVAWFLGIKS